MVAVSHWGQLYGLAQGGHVGPAPGLTENLVVTFGIRKGNWAKERKGVGGSRDGG